MLDEDTVNNYAVVANDELRQFSNFNDKVRCPVYDNPDCADIATQADSGTTRCNRQQYFDKVDVYLKQCQADQNREIASRPWSIEAQLGTIVGTWGRDCGNQAATSFYGSYCDATWPATCFKGIRTRTRQCCGDETNSASAFYCAEAFDSNGNKISKTCPAADGTDPTTNAAFSAADKVYWENHIDYVNENSGNTQSAAPGGQYSLPDCLWASWEPWSNPCDYLEYNMNTFEKNVANGEYLEYTYSPAKTDEDVRRKSDAAAGYKIAGETAGYLNDEPNTRNHTWYGYSAYLMNPENWLEDPDRVDDDGSGGTIAHDGKPNWESATPLTVEANKVFREAASTHLIQFKVLRKRIRFCREQLCPGPTPQECNINIIVSSSRLFCYYYLVRDATDGAYKCNEDITGSFEVINGVTYCRVMEETELESCPSSSYQFDFKYSAMPLMPTPYVSRMPFMFPRFFKIWKHKRHSGTQTTLYVSRMPLMLPRFRENS